MLRLYSGLGTTSKERLEALVSEAPDHG
jgi:hypothetical protein